MVHFMAHTLAGQHFSSSQLERDEEVFDADLCKRVFALSHSISYRMNIVHLIASFQYRRPLIDLIVVLK